MNPRKTLLSGIVLLGLLSWIFFYELPKGREKEKADLLFRNLTEQQIETIEIKKQDRTVLLRNRSFRAEKPEEKAEEEKNITADWEISDLPGLPVDASMVQSLTSPASGVLGLKLDNAIPKEEQDSNLSVYGLESPALVVKVSGAGGAREIRFGKKNDYVLKRYFQIAGDDRVFMGTDTLFTAADRSRKDFRKKNLVSFTDFEAKRLTIAKDGTRLVVEKTSDDGWKIVEPIKATASRAKLQEVFRELRDYKADDFIDFSGDNSAELLREYRVDAPDMSATIEKNDGDPLVVAASELEESDDASKKFTAFRVGSFPFIGKMLKSVLGRISMDPSDYRERKLFSYGDGVVSRGEIEFHGAKPIVLELEKDTWKAEGREADQMFVQQFFRDLTDLSAVRFPESSGDFGFDKPRLKITLWTAPYGSDEKPKPVSLVVGNETENGYYAASGDLSEPFVISPEGLKSVSPSLESLAPVPPASATAIPTPGREE